MKTSSIRLCSAIAVVAPLLLGGPAFAQATGEMFRGFQSDNNGPVNVEADSLDVAEKDGQRVSTFAGNVTVTRGDSVLKAGKIAIYSANQKAGDGAAKPAAGSDVLPGAGSFTRIEASGKVYVNSGDQTATGDNGVVDMLAQKVTMTGNVVLSQGPNVITGDRLVWDMQTGKARVDQKPGARIRGVFTPGATPGAPGAPAPGAAAKPAAKP